MFRLLSPKYHPSTEVCRYVYTYVLTNRYPHHEMCTEVKEFWSEFVAGMIKRRVVRPRFAALDVLLGWGGVWALPGGVLLV